MKREIIRKRSALSTVTALLMVLMMTVVMTIAGTFAVFADDTDPDPWQTNNRIRDVSEKQEITFRGEDPNNGPPPAPPLPGHGPGNDHDADPDDISGTDESPGSPNLSDFGDDGGIGNMYPELGGGNNNNNNDNHEIDNTSGDGSGSGPSEDDQLSSGPPEKEVEETDVPEKNKTGDMKIEGAADTANDQPETGGNAVIRVTDKASGTSEDYGKDKSGTDITEVSGSTGSSGVSAGSAGTGSPKTGDDNGLVDTMTLLILSTACLATMMHSRRNAEE